MTDFPQRLLDDTGAPSRMRNALAHAREDELDLGRLEQALTATLGRGASEHNPWASGPVGPLAATLGVVALTAGITVAIVGRGSSEIAVKHAPLAPSTSTPVNVTPAMKPETGPPSTDPTERGAVSVPVASLPAAGAVTPAARASAGSSLARELERLRAARRKVESGDAAGALDEVKRYEHDFPNGVLTPEIEVTRIEALSALGTGAEVRARGDAFLRRYPSSPQGPRIRSWLEKKP